MAVSAVLPREAPEAYIPSDRRVAIAAGRRLPERAHGAALFADISGFTALTEALTAQLSGHRASEELSRHLNRVFHALIAEVDRFGGSVIYFSGDAITCWFDEDDALRATASAFAMQQALVTEGRIDTPSGPVQLAMKVAVAVGSARRFLIGDPEIQLLDALAGHTLDRLATAEGHAGKGEVIVDRPALEGLGERAEFGEIRRDTATGEHFAVVRRLLVDVEPAPLEAPVRALRPDELKPWLLGPVYERLKAGRGEFLAELRPAIPMFVRFGSIDFESDPAAGAKLDDFVRRVQAVLAEYGGNVLQLTIGDKGAYLYAIFGAPVAHEDDARRAVAAGLEVAELEDGEPTVQIGITRGRLRSGTYGHELRRTYVCLGDAVNLAARLMSKAAPGTVLVDETLHAKAGERFEAEALEPLKLKGKAAPVTAYRVTRAHAEPRVELRYDLPMIGRRAELTALLDQLPQTHATQGHVVAVTAEAGVGKSRLVAELARSARTRGIGVHLGECQAFGTNTSYFVWQPIWRSLLGLAADDGPDAVEGAIRAIDPMLIPRIPLLSSVLRLPIEDTELTRAFDAKLRKESLEALLAECLAELTRTGPMLLVLEDCHWLDALSRDLLAVLAREAARLPVLIVLAERPAGRFGREIGVERLPHFSRVELPELEPADAERLVRSKARRHGMETPRALLELVLERAQGNAFYIEELVAYIRSEGIDPSDDRALAELELPDSLHSLILSRIDTLAEPPRRALKVASVIGRSFKERALSGVYPELVEVDASLATLCDADLVVPEHDAYLFNHVVTQEAAYESIPFSTRAELHERVGGYIEATERPLEAHLDLLAHHYWLSGNDDKKREFLLRAGDAAQGRYANTSAIEYFRRLAPLLPDGERGPVLRKLGKVLELVAEWDEAGKAYDEALELAGDDDAERAWAETSLGELARKRGRFEEAADWFARAHRGFEAAGVDEGTGLVLHLGGTLAAQRGDHDEARRRYEASLEIRRALDDKASMGGLFSNLGIVAEYEGDYERARSLLEQAIAVRLEAGDRWGVGVSRGNLGNIARLQGDLAEARDRLEDALVIQSEVGDRWMIANVQNNLANVLREQGDLRRAAALYANALRFYGDVADPWALAFLFEDVAALAAARGDAERALRLAAAAEVRREEIGTPRTPTDEQALDQALEPARSLADERDQAAAHAAGRDLDISTAVQEALAAC